MEISRSQWVLNHLYEYDSFLDSIQTVADMGCGIGVDSYWWATLPKIDESPRNIKVNAVDNALDLIRCYQHENINYIAADFSNSGLPLNSQNLIWAHNSLQYSLNPLTTLSHWHDILTVDGMLVISVPYYFYMNTHNDITNVSTTYVNGCFFNWTMGNLIMSLAATGFDCREAHFKIDRTENWLQAAVYKLPKKHPINTNWYDLLPYLPLTVEQALIKKGTFQESDIQVTWIDRSQYMLNI